MWLQHLFSFIGILVRVFFDGIGTTILGRVVDVAFASALAVAVLLKKNKEHGWHAMLNHWRQEYKAGIRFTLCCAVIIYTPVVVWAIGKAVYGDHEYFVGTAKKLHVSILEGVNTFSQTRMDLEGQISDWKAKCSGLEGANGVLSNQNRDQQNTINNCQTQALKLLTPQPFRYEALVLDSEPSGNSKKSTWLILTNKPQIPVEFQVNCTSELESVDVGIVQQVTASRVDHEDKMWLFQISSPAWTPESPIVVHTVSKGNGKLTCEFAAKGGAH
jgi:hypothetical protein